MNYFCLINDQYYENVTDMHISDGEGSEVCFNNINTITLLKHIHTHVTTQIQLLGYA